jgi:APA family basic amino acid/polyamine antiporter
MPRSGGEYIYNSRIIHPVVGIAESFGNAFVWIMWIYVLAPWIADPGFTMLAGFMGWQGLADFATNPWGMFVIATITNIVGFAFVVFGIKIFARVQKIIMAIGIGGTVVICVALSLYSKSDFVSAWNATAQQYHSLPYDGFISAVQAAAGQAMPHGWNFFDTLGVMVAGSWLFAYSYCITFIAGEVKRPDKTIILSNLFAILVPAVFMLWTAFALYHMVDFKFLSAAMWLDNNGTDLISQYHYHGVVGYNVPWSTHFLGLLAVVNSNKLLLFVAVLSFLAFDLWWVALSYLAFPRIIFAWGMDRMGPKWFTDVNPRWASPVKNHLLCLILGEIGIALYTLWQNNPLQGLTVTGLEIFSVFGVTAVAAMIFPYSKRARGIWEASPYRTWKLLGIPVVTLGAAVDLIYLLILAWFFFVMPASRDFTTNSGIFYVVIWALGISWYFFWRQRSKSVGVDVSMTYGELPPE